ncbi:hypothetical protein [Streptomyces sp. 2A115]|uniref:hypothetical protein n=1 Tax=Streptomyces sp. 2A115 TaxID=3457439 RepID=UPI003FCF0A46
MTAPSAKGPTSTSATSSYAVWRPSGRPGRCQNPRDAQIERLKAQNSALRDRVADRDKTIEELTAFKKLALSRLAAQHDEILHLRSPEPAPEPTPPAKLATVPRARPAVIGSCI